MKKHTVCPECEAAFAHTPGLVGQTIRCQTCSHVFVVTGPPAPAAAPNPAAGPPPAPPPLPPKKARGATRPGRDADDDRPRARAARYRDADDEAGRGAPRRQPKAGGLLIGVMACLGVLFVAVLGAAIVYLVWPNKQNTPPTAPAYAGSEATSSTPLVQPPQDDTPVNLDDILNQGKKNPPPIIAPPPRKPKGRENPGFAAKDDPPIPPAVLPPAADIAVKPLFPAAAPANLKPADFAGDTVEVASPHPISHVVPAGSGRYLLLHHDAHQKVSVLDVPAAKVVKTLPLGEGGAMIAGGHDFFVAYLPKANEFQRFSLKTLEPDQKAANPHAAPVAAVGMGAASNGPVVVCLPEKAARSPGRNQLRFFDPTAMKAADYPVDGDAPTTPLGVFDKPVVLRVSANGGVFGAWTRGFPFGVYTHAFVAGGRVNRYRGPHEMRGALPAADGKLVYSQDRAFGPTGAPVTDSAGGPFTKVQYLPAVVGPEYLVVNDEGDGFDKHVLTFAVRSAANNDSLVLSRVEGADGAADVPFGQTPRYDEFFFLIPAAKVLAVRPPKNPNSIILCKIK